VIHELRARWQQAQHAMLETGVDALVVAPSSDFAYLTTFRGHQSERLLLFCLPADGAPHLIAPGFEAPRFESIRSHVNVSLWQDGDDPYPLLRRILSRNPRRLALGSDLAARVVLRITADFISSEFVDGSTIIAPLRMRKSERELGLLAAAAAAADATASDLARQTLTGMSESDIAAFLRRRLTANGHEEATHANVAVGANAAVPHHHPSDATLKQGDAVVFDFGGTVGAYRSDVTRTGVVGNDAEAELLAVYASVSAANEAAVAAAKAGAIASDVDAAARRVITDAGYADYFTHRTGHGIGLDVHELPYIVAGDPTVLQPGMVFSVEPGVYLPGRFGVRIEDIVAVTSSGAERLNRHPHDLIRLG
jgi:Xaa-Pro aminopeptidase